MYERLLDILNGVGRCRVLLVGDFMLDYYVYGNTDRISPEAPVVVMNVTSREVRPGGAGSVAADLAVLGAETACVGIVGNDNNGERLREMLGGLAGVRVDGMVTAEDRPTTTKERIIGLAQHRHRQQLMRIDEEQVGEISAQVRKQLRQRVDELLGWCDVVCLEDYNKGVFGSDFGVEVIAAAQAAGKQVIVDPAAVQDYGRYRGAWMVKPNRRELSLAAQMAVDSEEELREAAARLAQTQAFEQVVVTLDKEGAYLYQKSKGKEAGRGELIPTRARNVYDVTGAGDMVLAMLGLLFGAHYEGVDQPSVSEVVCLANVAGGLEVERFGSAAISRDEIAAELASQRRAKAGKLLSVEALLRELQWHQQRKLRVVFTNGCFDILHPGHIHLLSFAKEQGDILVVAINSDRSVRSLKGPTRPILPERDRAVLLSALEAVDYIVVFDEADPLELIQQISPDVLVKGEDWRGQVVGQDWVEQNGGKVVLAPLAKGRSTSQIIEQVIEKNSSNRVKTGEV